MPILHFDRALTPAGWRRDVRITVEQGTMVSVEPDSGIAGDAERHGIGLPGVASLHSHAFQRGMAGLAEVAGTGVDTFWTWREVMYRFALTMSPEDVEAVATQLYVEMLEAGFTRVGEFHYLHHDLDGRPYANLAEMAERIAAAAQASGIGLTLLPVFYAHSDFGGAPPTEGQRRFICDPDRFAALHAASARVVAGMEAANIGIAPHSLRAVGPEELREILPLAAGGPVHIHAAEQVKEVEDCLAWSRVRPIDWLLDHAGVNHRWCVIHATHMTETETQRLAVSGAVAGLCPITEANLGDGTFGASEFLAAGGGFGIGTDSNVSIGIAEELRQLEYAQRLRRRQRNVLARPGGSTGRALLEAALAGGNQALGRPEGGLAPGAPADIVSLRADHPSLAAHDGDAMIDTWIFAGGKALVDCVWTSGVKRVQDGRHFGRQEAGRGFSAALNRLTG